MSALPLKIRLAASGLLVAAACSGPVDSTPVSTVEVRALMGSRSACVDVLVRGESKVEGARRALALQNRSTVLGIANRTLGAWADVEAVGKLADCTTDSGERTSGRLTFPGMHLVLELGPAQQGDASVGDSGTADAGADDAGVDAGTEDAGTVDAGFDAGAVDAGFDAGAVDAGFDAGAVDAGFDAGAVDAGFDAGAVDAGFDAGTVDAGRVDAGTMDAGRVDAGTVDAGTDAGPVDAGPPDAGKDQDLDGYPESTDCNDLDPAVHPGALELCVDKTDNDCDLRVDCADLDCLNLSCASGVTGGAACRSVTGVDGGVCREETCNDGTDNDGDLSADCADNDCASLACVDTLACTSGGGSCSAGRCVEPIACTTPPAGTCMRQCRDDATFMCTAQPAPAGFGCDDGDLCTVADGCGDAGTCAGTPKSCPAPGVCQVGFCHPADGGCASRLADAGSACATDNNVCTDDVCNATGGCTHSVLRHQACPGGSCAGDGGCVANNFLFDVSNVNEDDVTTWSTAAMPSGCTLRLNTSGATATVLAGTTCAAFAVGATVPSQVLTQQSGSQVMVLARTGPQTWNLRLEFVGTRPVVVLVRGDLTVDGVLSVSAVGITDGAGDGPCTTGTGQSTTSAIGAAGGGFGTVGAAGHNLSAAPATTPGTVEGSATLVPLRGGCRGGSSSTTTVDTATGGGGGGALQLSVSGTLALNGRLLASGGGGEAGTYNSGGAGGGSGGAVFLEARTLALAGAAVVAANGGGGGQADTTGGLGEQGLDGLPSATPAHGGQSMLFCTEYGGNGAAGNTAAGRPRAPQGCSPWVGSGGGGGGGTGRIRLRGIASCGVAVGAVVSPGAICGP